ncbi:hypothetical protein WME94_43365 [Sorangium sp. So ce429]
MDRGVAFVPGAAFDDADAADVCTLRLSFPLRWSGSTRAGAGFVLAQFHEIERQVTAPVAAATRVRIVCECYTAYR